MKKNLFEREEGKGKDRKVKNESIYAAYTCYGYTLEEIAEQMGVHYTTISRSIKQAEEANKEK
jgi:transposase